jgi:glycosyltransferase involved in cell wall biosynthesis
MKNNYSVSIIVTVLNEATTISQLLQSFKVQTYQAGEIIIVDGGSTDETLQLIKAFSKKHPGLNIKTFVKNGNRSVGRNEAIKNVKSNWIAITDAGCAPRKNWLEELIKPIADDKKKKIDVVAGYYAGKSTDNFQAAVIPYVLVMPDRVNPQEFLPATRSMLINKKVWQDLGGFSEKLSHNEDYDFAKKIKKNGYQIVFAQQAIVDWLPVKNLSQFYKMVTRFAEGDIEAGILRPKVIFIFGRYLILLLLVSYLVYQNSIRMLIIILLLALVVYLTWSILKNKKYVSHGWFWLPLLQIISDLAVMIGSVRGLF